MLRREDGTSHATDKVKAGIHHFLGGEIQRKHNKRIVAEGKHIFQNKEWQKKNIEKQFRMGRHCSQIKKECEHCGKITDSANYSRWHGDNCRHIK